MPKPPAGLTSFRLAIACIALACFWLVASHLILLAFSGPTPQDQALESLLDVAVTALGLVLGIVLVRRFLADAHRIRRAAEARSKDLELHVAAGRALLDAEDERDLMKAFCAALVDHGARSAWVGVPGAQGRVEVLTRAGEDGGYLDSVEIHLSAPDPLAMGPIGRAFREGRTTVADDVASDPTLAPWRERLLAVGFHSAAAIPLVAEDARIGVLTVYWGTPRWLTPESLASLERVAGDLARGMLALRRRNELAAASDRLSRVLDASPNPILLVDQRAVIAYANPTAADAFGYPMEELVGLDLRALVPTDSAADHRALVADYQADPRVRRIGQRRGLRGVRKDGTTFPADVSLGPVWIEGELNIVATLVDLTERTALEVRLLQAQKMEVMGQFANILAHDFRNYLAAIGGFAELLADDLAADNPSRPDVDQIRIAVDQGSALITNVLAFARPPGGEAAIADVASVLAATTPLVRRLVGSRVVVQAEAPEGLPGAAIEPSLLGQVLVNLATNARDAMPDGGTLTLSASRNGEGPNGPATVEVAVADTGSGMPPEVMERVFDAFFTTKDAGDGGGTGTGLGLASVQFIVGRAGGRVTIDSSPGAGSTFRVSLPVAGPARLDSVAVPE